MFLKQGDMYPPLRADLNADITGAQSVTLNLQPIHGGTVLSKAMTVIDASNGIVEYAWAAGETDQLLGDYLADVTVVFLAGEVQHFPQRSDLELTVLPSQGTYLPGD